LPEKRDKRKDDHRQPQDGKHDSSSAGAGLRGGVDGAGIRTYRTTGTTDKRQKNRVLRTSQDYARLRLHLGQRPG